MRILVLGGTMFVSKTVAAEALRRGHEVICAARGTSGEVPEGARLVRVDRDDPDGLAPLAGERFDSVVDVATMNYRWVAEALRTLGSGTAHWTFVSTISVYADKATRGQTVDGPLLEPITDEPEADSPHADPELYGSIKVASENAVREAMDGRAFIPRPGLITGPGDRSDRFGYWPARMHRGGWVLVPHAPEQPAQHIDVRDFATWIVDAAEQRLTGTFDAIGPAQPLNDLLGEIAEVVGPKADLVPMPEDKLVAAGVRPWAGPRSLPLWLPPGYEGMISHDPQPAFTVGLRVRPLAETAADSLAHEQALGLDRERKAGLSAAEERELLEGINPPKG